MSRRQFGRVRQLPSGRWQARYAVDDGDLRTAPRTFPTKGDAARYLATIETDLARGQYIDPRLGTVTLSEWAEQWLTRPGKRANSVARDRQALEAFLRDLGGRPLASITPMHVQGVVDARAKLVSPATLARDFSALRAVLNSAVDADIIGRSPARKIALPRPRPPRRVGLRPDELEKLASEVPGRYRALVLVAGILGLRWGEAVGLRVGDIDFLRRTVTVSQVVEETAGHIAVVRGAKTDAGLRTLSAPAFLVDELARHLAEYRQIVAGDPEGPGFRRSSGRHPPAPVCRTHFRPCCCKSWARLLADVPRIAARGHYDDGRARCPSEGHARARRSCDVEADDGALRPCPRGCRPPGRGAA